MENRENREENVEVPTRTEILDYILTFNQRPVEVTLSENQYTVKRLMEESGFSKDWCKTRLREMWKANLCERELVVLRKGNVAVYTFPDELPDLSS